LQPGEDPRPGAVALPAPNSPYTVSGRRNALVDVQDAFSTTNFDTIVTLPGFGQVPLTSGGSAGHQWVGGGEGIEPWLPPCE
jgi:hypothetical protein